MSNFPNDDEVSLPSRPVGQNGQPRPGNPGSLNTSPNQQTYQQPPQPQQSARPTLHISSSSPTPAPAAPTHSAMQPNGEPAQIPDTKNPVEMNVLLEGLNLTTIVGKDNVMEGKLTVSDGECIMIKGTFKGDINCPGVLIIANTGTVEGNINAGQCWIEGEVASKADHVTTINASVLHLGVGSKVAANCTYEQLSISTPNRGVSGTMNSRDTINASRK